MDTHPIPQNVTSFQFKLVGEMTLKQFMYLAIGMIIAYINFVFLASSIPIIAWPIIIISASTGAAFAFLPIADRPLDHWLGAFLKAVYSPTKMIWKKDNNPYNQDSYFNNRLQVYLKNITPNLKTKSYLPPATERSNQPMFKTEVVETRPTTFAQSVAQPTTPAVLPTVATPIELPTKDELAQTVELAKQAQSIQVQIIQSQRQLSELKNATGGNPQINQQVNQLLTNLQALVSEASGIKQKLDTVTHAPVAPRARMQVTTVTPAKPKPTQIILTTTPNVINGFVSDAMGNYLTNAVVVIYDKQGLPVRALKTNKLGQFSGATPLPNGTYTIQLEKDNLVFDVLQLDLTGEVLPALTIAAKKVL